MDILYNLIMQVALDSTRLLRYYEHMQIKESTIRILTDDFSGGKGGDEVPPKYADGSFRIRPNGILEYRFMHLDKQISVYASGINAKQICYDKRTAIISNNVEKKAYTKTLTYGEFLEQWQEKKRKQLPKLSKSTLSNIERCVRLHITNKLKNIKLKHLKPYMLEECLNNIDSSRMRKYVFTIFSDSLSFAKANGLIDTELWKLIDVPNHKIASKRPLEDEEYNILIENAPSKLKRIIIGYCWTGCRRNELLSIKYKDIKDGIISVYDEKTKKYKTIPLFPPLAEVIGNGQDEEYVFNATPTWVNKNIRSLCDKLGLTDITPHCFRNTFGSVLYDAGVDIKTIQLWLGHNTLKVTQDIYTKKRKSSINKDIKNIIDKMFSTLN